MSDSDKDLIHTDRIIRDKKMKSEWNLDDKALIKMRLEPIVDEMAEALAKAREFDTSNIDLDEAVPYIMEEMSMRDEYDHDKCVKEYNSILVHVAWCEDLFEGEPYFGFVKNKLKERVKEASEKIYKAYVYEREGTIITDVERNPYIGNTAKNRRS